MSNAADFAGAKIALFCGGRLVVIRRDDIPCLAWPGYLDLPGGGREGDETPETCVIREVREEVGLTLRHTDLSWRQFYTAPRCAWFFAAHLAEARAGEIVFGDEGQEWLLMRPETFVSAEDAIPHFRDRVGDYLAKTGPVGSG